MLMTSAARNGVLNAIHFWYKETCINFIPRTNERHYLTFIGNDYGCWSTVGKDGYEGKQVVSIGAGLNPNYQQGMGQMKEPTFLDVAILNKHYRCEQKCRYLVDCLNGGYTNPRTCTTCKCPSGFSGTYCERIEPSYSRHCGGEITVDGTTRRFEMSVTQNSVTSDKKCIYHLKAPQGRRISINLLKVNGRCSEGCWQDGVEFKMTADYRLTGFRFCCPETTRRSFVSETNLIPLIIYTSRRRIEVAFEYSIENQRFFDLESGNPNVIDSDNEHIFNNVVYHGNSRDGIIAAISD
ncbi:hypothetical protein WR25_11837 [Diploscapter pachys]|uniref:Metalloendopeptidase n=1 Tax=Diploscapter pachys TaxID=2018661 RepID=A0A2A2KS36_9BILA|nr:hypothetical protein WR25_11837 [Diploscapter pachys]